MNNSKNNLFTGLVLILLGGIFLLINYDVLDIHFRDIIKLWPLLLIGLGISALTRQAKHHWIIVVGVLLFFCIFFALTSFRDEMVDRKGNRENSEHFQKRGKVSFQEINEPYEASIKEVELSIEAAAGNYSIGGITESLIKANIESNFLNYIFNHEINNGKSILKLELEDDEFTLKKKKNNNEVQISLNANPTYSISVDAGAANLDMDLSGYQVSAFKLDAGAANVKIKLGKSEQNTELDFDLGASKLEIVIPKERGCRIKSDMGLSSKSFEGFSNKGDGIYETDNYASSESKINLNLDAGLAKVEISRY